MIRAAGAIEVAAVLRRLEQIAANGRAASLIDSAQAMSITLVRIDALADDLRKGLHDLDGVAGPESGAATGGRRGGAEKVESLADIIRREAADHKTQIVEDWEPKHG